MCMILAMFSTNVSPLGPAHSYDILMMLMLVSSMILMLV